MENVYYISSLTATGMRGGIYEATGLPSGGVVRQLIFLKMIGVQKFPLDGQTIVDAIRPENPTRCNVISTRASSRWFALLILQDDYPDLHWLNVLAMIGQAECAKWGKIH